MPPPMYPCMSQRHPILAVLALVAAVVLRAQSTLPAVSQALPALTLPTGGAAVTLDLRNGFNLAGVSGQVVQFDTVLGKFNVELLANDAPQSVTNFLSYVSAGSYSNTIFHRAAALGGGVANRIIQGGGYDPAGNAITTQPPIPLEYKLPNIRGTLAMARTSDVNSATSEWFFNVDDNTTVLGVGNGGGYAVFGRVVGSGMSVVDAIAALPTYNAGGTFTSLPLRDVVAGQTSILLANEIVVNSVTALPMYPLTDGAPAVLSFSVSSSNPAVASATVAGSTLTVTPLALGIASIAVHATDTNSNFIEGAFTVTVAPKFTAQPAAQSASAGGSVTFSAAASGATGINYQWQLNGSDLNGATTTTLSLTNLQPANAGLYTLVATSGVANTSDPAILGLVTTSKVIGAGTEIAQDIFVASNGNTFDQVLPSGAAVTVTADPKQITRTSFVDLTDDIVQVEFSGAGSLSLVLDTPSGPALPVNYNQSVLYMKGHVGLVITGADDTTNVSAFSVGKITAVNQALFKSNVTYDGRADVAFIAIASKNGKFGGLRASNANFYAAKGLTGVYAPGVAFQGPVFVGNINASDAASPVLMIGSSPDTRITGGDLLQANGAAVQVSGLTQLKFTAGSDSQGNLLAAKTNQGILLQNGADVTAQIVVNPSP